MKKSNIKILVIAVISVIIKSNTVFAAEGDIYDLSNSSNIAMKYTHAQIATSAKKQHEVMNNPSNYAYEAANGKIYTLEQINNVIDNLYNSNPNMDDSVLIDETFVYVQNNLTPTADASNLIIDFDVDVIY